MNYLRLGLSAALLLASSGVATAQTVHLEFHDGRVTLRAENAAIRTILTEWGRIGGTQIVNGDRVTGAPLTLELTNVPERQALDIVLRSVSGYMAGPRAAAASSSSSFDRIMILPTSTPQRTTAPPTAFMPQQPQPMPQPVFEADDPEENPPDDVPPPEADGPFQRGRPFRRIAPGASGPGTVQAQPFPPEIQPDPDVIEEPADAAPPASNPFGIVPGSNRPGVITPVPQQPRGPGRPNGDPEP
jgi:hypothetical protein